jgi:hypothetical protein
MKHKKIIKHYVETLEQAKHLAIQNRDVEALVAISDRWYALMDSMDEEGQNKIVLGFTSQENDDDSRKTGNKRKG